MWTKAVCLTHPHRGETWVIDLGEEDAIVYDGANTVVAKIPLKEVADTFSVSAPLNSDLHISIRVGMATLRFQTSDGFLPGLDQFMARAIVAGGTQQMTRLRLRMYFWRFATITLGLCTVVGIGAVVRAGAIDFRGLLAAAGLLLAAVTANHHSSRLREQLQDVRFQQGRPL